MYDDTADNSDAVGDFRRHLEEATEVVNSWPSWKQSVLGRAIGISEPVSIPDLRRECADTNLNEDT